MFKGKANDIMRIYNLFLLLILLLITDESLAKDKTVDVSELINNINYNSTDPIEYDGTIIQGDFNLFSNGIYTINKQIIIKNSIFKSIVNLNNIDFKERVIFENVSFDSHVNLSGAHFYKESEFLNCVFKKDLDLNYTRFDRISNFSKSTINGSSEFEWAQFNGYAEFIGVNFNYVNFFNTSFNQLAVFKWANFADAEFEYANFYRGAFFDYARFGKVNFQATIFNKYTYFPNCIFKRIAEFESVKFNGIVDFSDSKFYNASFTSCDFDRFARFNNITFNNITKFSKSRFFEGCDFSDSNFSGETRFNDLTINKKADFTGTCFEEGATFHNSTFKDKSLFDDAKFFSHDPNNETGLDCFQVQFIGPTYFRRVILNINASFEAAQFGSDAYFYGCIFNKDVTFNQAKFNSNAFFEDSKILGTLRLGNVEYNRLYIRINNIYNIEYNESAYKSLIENFKRLGLFNDAYQCYYRFMIAYANDNLIGFKTVLNLYNKIAERNEWSSIGPLPKIIGDVLLSIYYILSWIIYGFGTKPNFTLIWSLILILVFGLFWTYVSRINTSIIYINEYDWNEYQDTNQYKKDIGKNIHLIINPFLLSTAIFLSGTKFFIDPPKIPQSFIKSTPLVNWMYSFERFLGGIFSILFIIAIGSMISSI